MKRTMLSLLIVLSLMTIVVTRASGPILVYSIVEKVVLEPGDSWVVPKGTLHTYNILESFTAVEATYPPAHAHGRDEEE